MKAKRIVICAILTIAVLFTTFILTGCEKAPEDLITQHGWYHYNKKTQAESYISFSSGQITYNSNVDTKLSDLVGTYEINGNSLSYVWHGNHATSSFINLGDDEIAKRITDEDPRYNSDNWYVSNNFLIFRGKIYVSDDYAVDYYDDYYGTKSEDDINEYDLSDNDSDASVYTSEVNNEPTVDSKSVVESKPVEDRSVTSIAQEDNTTQFTSKTDMSSFYYNTPFYGVWVKASKSYDDAVAFSGKVSSNGFNSFVEDTTNWSNLNSEKWYIVTAGKYASENEAKNELEEVKKYYPDAYVKYSGEYKNTNSYHPAFYGIWVKSSKSYDDAANFADGVSSNGFNGFVEITTDWSNLNNEKWYVVTAGKYASENEAKNNLEKVKKYYPDAYIKYSGNYINN